jgi:CysZ protein
MLKFLSQFKEGFSFGYSGVRLIFQRDMLRWVLVPFCLSVIICGAGLLAIGLFLYEQIDHYLGLWPSYFRNFILWFLICTLSSSISFLLFALSNLLAAPFNSQLSAAVEYKLGNSNSSGNMGLMKSIKVGLASMGAEIRKLSCFLKIGLPLLILTLIPGPSLFAPIAWVWFGSWMLSLEYIDYPLSNHGRDFPESKNYAARERGLTLGLGFALTIITLIPLVNCVAMPAGVAAGTNFYVQK